MKREQEIARLIAMIEAKYHARGCLDSFNTFHRTLFNDILANLPHALALAAVKQVVLFSDTFVPDPSELLLAVARLASPLPDKFTAWRQVSARIAVFRPKPCSHSQIEEAVADLGGYNAMDCRYNNTPMGVILSRFLEAYELRRQRWETDVRQMLLQPPCAWDWRLLPRDNPLLLEVDHERVRFEQALSPPEQTPQRLEPEFRHEDTVELQTIGSIMARRIRADLKRGQ